MATPGATGAAPMVIDQILEPNVCAKALLPPQRAVFLDTDSAAENHDVKFPTGAVSPLEFHPGITIEEGMPGSTSRNPDQINIQSLGIGKIMFAADQIIVPGDRIIADSDGRGIKRTPFSSSGPCLGFAFQRRNVVDPKPGEVFLLPHFIEVVMPITGGSDGAAIGAATKYLAAPGVAVAAAELPLFVCDAPGKLRNLRCSLKTAPGGADTVIFAVLKSSDNGASWTATTLTCTITGAAKAASDKLEAHAVDVAAGDLIAIRAISSAGTAAGPAATVSFT